MSEGRFKLGRWPDTVLGASDVQALRSKLVQGETLSISDTMKLISSHEQMRAFALVTKHKNAAYAQENDDLHLLVRRLEKP